jgi:hypothetical protein
MLSSQNERRYSDREFALILRAAQEAGAGPAPATPRQGLTLAEIQDVAREVGIDPNRVARAAALLSASRPRALIRILGGNPRLRLEHTVPAGLSAADLGRVVDVARKVLDTQGETREVLGGLEWKDRTSAFAPVVSVIPREGETVLQASTDGTEAMVALYGGVGLPLGFVITVTLGKLFFGVSDLGVLTAFALGMPPAFLVARGLWGRSARKWRGRLFHLMDAMTQEAEATTGRASGAEGTTSEV